MVSCTYVVVFWTLMDLKIIQDWLMSGTRRGVPPLREGREVGGAVRLKQQMRCDQWLPTMGLTTFPSNKKTIKSDQLSCLAIDLGDAVTYTST